MPRRGGKAARRRSRQRSSATRVVPRPARAPLEPPGRPGEPAAADAPIEARVAPASPPPAPSYARGPSGLGERGRAEYHYVSRDLRNIGVLVVIMAALLAAAAVAFNALDLV